MIKKTVCLSEDVINFHWFSFLGILLLSHRLKDLALREELRGEKCGSEKEKRAVEKEEEIVEIEEEERPMKKSTAKPPPLKPAAQLPV
jgi:hypothetical protein